MTLHNQKPACLSLNHALNHRIPNPEYISVLEYTKTFMVSKYPNNK